MDDQLIAMLRHTGTTSVPEQRLSEELGLCTSALRREVRTLQEQGYTIENHPLWGVRLMAAPDRMLKREILYGLRTHTIGREMYCYDRVGSTNDVAARLAMAGAVEGTMVVAECQTRGRGRLGRTWHSPAGRGLWVSWIVRPVKNFAMQEIGMCAGIAVSRVVRRMVSLDIRLKWPNDVVIQSRKLGGILGEIGSDRWGGAFVIVGLGLNVNQREEDFPDEIRDRATSLRIETGQDHYRVKLLQRIMEEMEYTYAAVHLGDSMAREWKELCSTLGKWVGVHLGGRRIVGRAVDVRSDGALVIEGNDGQREEVRAGELIGAVEDTAMMVERQGTPFRIVGQGISTGRWEDALSP